MENIKKVMFVPKDGSFLEVRIVGSPPKVEVEKIDSPARKVREILASENLLGLDY